MEFWQTRCMRRTENPENVVRFHETPLHGDDSSDGQNAGLWIRRSRVRSPFFTPMNGSVGERLKPPPC